MRGRGLAGSFCSSTSLSSRWSPSHTFSVTRHWTVHRSRPARHLGNPFTVLAAEHVFEVGQQVGNASKSTSALPVVERTTITAGRRPTSIASPSNTPKSEAGGRTIALDAGTIGALRDHRKRQMADRLAAGPSWIDSRGWSADYVDRDEQVRAYTEVFDGLARIALDEPSTARLITDCMGDPR